ncbi:UxaA family hydrolase [Cucumibacter marinus]|uniref:UxaA family hydrolase n=1 Tax=Cucumibacter marinus TaxID=1121252 RepID=UPI0004297DC2|nr:UxaA family hydrolase [Cucumibacter marinus]
MTDTDSRLLLLSPQDNVFVLRAAIKAGETIRIGRLDITVPDRLGIGHKVARGAIRDGEPIIKYGAPIGSATRDIAVGEHVHIHNIKSNYTPTHSLTEARETYERNRAGGWHD